MKNLAQQISQMSPLKVALAAKQLAPKMSIVNAEPIAIVGMGCRFPGGVNNPEQYWQLLKEGKDAVVDMPTERWDVEAHYDADPEAPGKMNTRHGGFLDNVDEFDAQFFGISPREAAVLDPQQRLLLEVAWESLEHAGIVPASLHNTNTSVHIGITTSEYEKLCLQSDIAGRTGNNHIVYMGTGNDTCAAAGRLSYALGLTGPSMSVNTACSSSLVATHLACDSLRQRNSNIALAGGVNLTLIPDIYTVFSKAGMLSADGRCKSFDASADGYVRGEGCGIVVLKRLSDAIADGDNVLGLIRGSAVNQDGRSSGLTVPNGPAQQKVVQQALDNSGVKPEQVGYVEAHGTGTSLGDPIEVGALGAVFNASRDYPLLIGSAKTNIGHLESGAGAAGLIKTILSLQHGEIPPNLHFNEPSPHIAWDDLNINVVTETTPWPSKRRIAGVSSFGYSGTNAHIVLEATPEHLNSSHSSSNDPSHLLTLSARTAAALVSSAENYITYLHSDKSASTSLADICMSANTRRSLFAHRLSVVADSKAALATQLTAFVAGKQNQVKTGSEAHFITAQTAFLFTGQGSQYVGMGRELYETQPTFHAALEQCNELLKTELEHDLLDVLYPQDANKDLDADLINQTAYTQPALFALEYALATLWQSWGIQPKMMLGHSVGEYAAACVAGVFSLADGLRLIAARGRLMQALPQEGAMMAIRANETQVLAAVSPYAAHVSVAALNGPESMVISGETSAVLSIGQHFDAQGIKTKQLTVSHAFHSPLMQAMLTDFAQVANTVNYHKPTIDIVSNVTGKKVNDEMTQAAYWVNHVREAVHFNAGMAELEQQGCNVFIEIGAQPTLLGMGQACVQNDSQALWLPSLRLKRGDWQQMLESVAELFVHDIQIDWHGFAQHTPRNFVHLPTYPFQRQRHWIPDAPLTDNRSSDALHPLVDTMLQSPLLAETILETAFSTAALPFLLDHQVFDEVVVPGASHLAMVLSGTTLMEMGDCQLDDVIFPAPLVLPEAGTRKVQVVFSPEENSHNQADTFSFQLISSSDDSSDTEAITHATGRVIPTQVNPNNISLTHLQAACQEVLDANSIYDTAAEQHIVFGDSFRWITALWAGKGEALAQLSLPVNLSLEGYELHPGLLDACFQVAGVTLDESHSEETILPFMLKQLQVFNAAAGETWWCHTKQVDDYAWDVTLFDAVGQVILSIEQFEMRPVPRDALLQQQLSDWLYQVDWKTQALVSNEQTAAATTGNWLIFAEQQNTLAQALAERLKTSQHDTILVNWADDYHCNNSTHFSINPQQIDHFQQVLDECFIQTEIACLGVLYLAGNEAQNDVLAQAQHLSVTALHIAQSLTQQRIAAKLWLVTQGAQSVESDSTTQLAQAALWGFGRTLAIEQSNLSCVCLDLPLNNQTECLTILSDELANASNEDQNEDQIAWRSGVRYVARLAQYQATELVPEGAFRIQLRDYGSPDELQLVTIDRCAPAADEVEIEVCATALNFRDVLNALGMLKTYYAEVLGIERAEDVPLGFECAGKVVAVGENVQRLTIGDEVVAATEGSFASFVNVDAALVARKPDSLSFEEAAGIPTAFLTAYYGLNKVAQLKQGERILIHSAAGGVGQAAVQLAHAVGAEVFATASTGKWQALQAQGIQHVMNSRTLDFADEIMHLTNGEGVEVVLNSLNGDFINKSFDVLAQQGRLVEIGKIGVWSQEQVDAYRPDANYYPFDLGEVTTDDPTLMTTLLDEIMVEFEHKVLSPLPQTVFSVGDVANAYRYMQQTKHIGKVVLQFNNEATLTVQANKSYIVTGGLGGLGLHVAQYLVDQGARFLVLASRSGASSNAAQDLIQTLKHQGVSVAVVQADVAKSSDITRLLEMAQLQVPLGGIIHAAGVIDDAAILKQTPERFAQVMAPKVAGAWHLHTQTLAQAITLDFFVCFSSIASLMGSPGQTNYSAANAVIDLLMQQRRTQGLAGLSINWGPWSEIGMAADLSFGDEGLDKIAPETGIQILDHLIHAAHQQSTAQIGVFPMNWTTFMKPFADKLPPFISQMQQKVLTQKQAKSTQKKGNTATATVNIVQTVQQAQTPEERLSLLIKHIGQQLNQVLELDIEEETPTNQYWNELGLDSLMTVELKNSLNRTLGVSIPLETIMQEATTELLATMALDGLNEQIKDSKNSEDEASKGVLSNPILNTQAALDEDVEMLRQIPQTYVDVKEQKQRQVLIDGKWRSDFASCNYLGMDLHPEVIASIPKALDTWGVHPSWTRAVASPGLYRELEQELAALVGCPETLVFPSIHLLHIGVLPLLAGFNGVIIKDSSAHHSIYEACLRSQADGVEWTEFAHNNLEELEKKLQRYRPEQTKIIAIDGVYSMSGGFPPLPEMVKLAKQYNAMLYIDDAHGFGVIGENPSEAMPYGHGGRGIIKYFDLDYEQDNVIYVAGLSKTFSSYGAFITCFDDAMRSRMALAGPFIFSGPSPVASLASALAGLKVNRSEGEQMRSQVHFLTRKLVDSARAIGYEVDNDQYFPIVGVVIGDVDEVTEACQLLWEYDVLITPAIYPAVPMHRNLVRFSITASNTEAEIDQAIVGLQAVWDMIHAKSLLNNEQ